MAVATAERDAVQGPASPQRCIVLIPADRTAPMPLLVGLAQRQVTTVVVTDAPSVMLQLAAMPATAVIVAEPEAHPRLTELLAAIRRYYPRTRLWQYRSHGRDSRPTLARFGRRGEPAGQGHPVDPSAPAPAAAAGPAPVADPAPGRAEGGDVGVAGDEPGPDKHRPSPRAGRPPSYEVPTISAEELAMLLGPAEEGEQEDASVRSR